MPMWSSALIRAATLLAVPAAAAAAAAIAATGALAQGDPASNWPRQPVKIVVGLAPGAVNDVLTRVIAGKLAERLGQPVVVENRTGAGGNIAAEFVARAAPDGYTLYTAPTSAIMINPAVYTKLNYDPLRDFAPITQVAVYPLYLTVGAGLPAKTVSELLAHAKANPDKANLATPGTFFDLMAALLTIKSGVKFVSIPYKSTAETLTSVITGQAMIAYIELNTLMPQLKAGKVRALAATSPQRSAELPDVPSMAEAGFPEAVAQPITGIMAPRATPPGIVKRLETEIVAVMKQPDVVARFKSMGLNAVGTSSAEFGKFIATEIKRWSAVAKAANIKLD